MSEDGLHRVADADSLSHGDRIVTEVRGREVCVFNLDGEYYGLSNYCVHQGGPACEGARSGQLTESDGELRYERSGEFVSCPWHGWKFDIRTGEDLARPDDYRLPTYETVERDGGIYVRL
ncbi:Rieske (2Fe-2S) protein [Halomicrobium salinisoli]|uniref:Rieske (2Fe-2S) protein n=1 Tax=Halomicrobium salinisoli TaxID=2878391 RepID=UPI001CF0781D|nr:Rieske (2Fe-2S) protein [Halomicrobium salinisoli]